MKTKSKRFLNLATLCLALLGTTLLMGRPVKAEAVTQTTEGVQQIEENAEDRDIKEEYMKRMGITDSDLEDEEQAYLKKRVQGYLKGYADGQKLNAPEQPSDYNPSSDDDYNDGYTDGYSRSWHKTNQPIRTALYDAFEWFVGWLERFFEGR
ncbi:TPA: hypothetical protein ACO0XE_000214 [Streptococcus pyogenes]|uniref:hypothetical protein n=1 Tax=Streptococcus pyogenes TaxID=1314 RepID=UPI000A1D6DC9|nr:hypothetical protein [Streptococcus pyogenes]NAZ56027.1 hypothetical protein [Streptococcus pyogenes]OUI71906.1 hypothetical protein B7R59_05860 [Streptococcus pyogenes]QCK46950.1 hypothetical protein ETT60_01930 [Streptococcus pyogenes]SQF39471.1 hypothetical membrane associated protein [Streptococcus pyogenes]VGT73089.1 hypothetical membrane associated protein [Streptococcus pyogenes]